MITNNDFHDELVRRIRNVGETLIKNAEDYVGTTNRISGLDIYVEITDGTIDSVPEIVVTKKSVPARK